MCEGEINKNEKGWNMGKIIFTIGVSFVVGVRARLQSLCENHDFASGHDFSRAGTDAAGIRASAPEVSLCQPAPRKNKPQRLKPAGWPDFFGMAEAMP